MGNGKMESGHWQRGKDREKGIEDKFVERERWGGVDRLKVKRNGVLLDKL